jgi:hypothetical protein
LGLLRRADNAKVLLESEGWEDYEKDVQRQATIAVGNFFDDPEFRNRSVGEIGINAIRVYEFLAGCKNAYNLPRRTIAEAKGVELENDKISER